MTNNRNPFADPLPAVMAASSAESLKPNCMKLLEHLRDAKTINFLQARELGIGQLDRQIAELRKSMKVHSRMIRLGNVRCMEYSLKAFD